MSTTETAFAINELAVEVRKENESSRGSLHTSSTTAGFDAPAIGEESANFALDVREQLRTAKRTLIIQSQQISDLESYLECIVRLHARVRELELDSSL